MNLVRLHHRTREADAPAPAREVEDAAVPKPSAHPAGQLEQDVLLTMRVLGDAADEVHTRVGESLGYVNLIREACADLSALSESAQEATVSLARTTAAFEQSNRDITLHVGDASESVGEARDNAAGVRLRMQELAESVSGIARIVEVISTIARQTNMLALNATIEAARAGAAGRGFGVVAGEVKNLANAVQRATLDIAAKIDGLERVSRESAKATEAIVSSVGKVEPALDLIRKSVETQADSTRIVASRASESAEFARAVAGNATTVETLARESATSTENAGRAGANMTSALERLTQRSMVFLRNASSASRRRFARVPVRLEGRLDCNGRSHVATVLDVSCGGALIDISGFKAPNGTWGSLYIQGVGDMDVTILSNSFHGIHLRFESIADASLIRIEEIIEQVYAENRRTIEACQSAAAAISKGFETAIREGRCRPADLVTINYRMVAGSNPAQYTTDATPVYDHVLPPILESGRQHVTGCLYFVAFDLNAYLPCHHPEFSQAQRSGEYEWNDLNCRHRRIMERSRTLAVARNSEEVMVSLIIRDMSDGSRVLAKAICAPVFVERQLWGNVVTALPL